MYRDSRRIHARRELLEGAKGIRTRLLSTPFMMVAGILLLSACTPSVVAPATAIAPVRQEANAVTTAQVDLRNIAYDPTTSGTVVEEGRVTFVRELRPRHAIKWEESIMLFPTDSSMVSWAAELTRQAGLDAQQGEKVLRYFLAVRHGYGSSPCE